MKKAETIIEQLREVYNGNRFHFDFQVSQIISGDHNKDLRRAIVLELTGERRPLSKCGMYAVSDVLKNSFDQLSLFDLRVEKIKASPNPQRELLKQISSMLK